MTRIYYNEIDPVAAQWLRNLIDAGHIAPGDVDDRSIEDVKPTELAGYTQCHFFAGIGIWSYSLRRAGWPVGPGTFPLVDYATATSFSSIFTAPSSLVDRFKCGSRIYLNTARFTFAFDSVADRRQAGRVVADNVALPRCAADLAKAGSDFPAAEWFADHAHFSPLSLEYHNHSQRLFIPHDCFPVTIGGRAIASASKPLAQSRKLHIDRSRARAHHCLLLCVIAIASITDLAGTLDYIRQAVLDCFAVIQRQ